MKAKLGDGGTVIVRPSGTEPVLRIYVEARDRTVASSSGKCPASPRIPSVPKSFFIEAIIKQCRGP